jgi:hypothetical protein
MTIGIEPKYNFIAAILGYALGFFLVFGVVYASIGMEENFDVGETKGNNLEHAFYHSWCVMSTSMDEITPKTIKGRIAQACQVAVAYLPMILLLAPWDVRDS